MRYSVLSPFSIFLFLMCPSLANLSLHLPSLGNLSLATHAFHPCPATCLSLKVATLWPCVSLPVVAVMEMPFLLFVL